MADFDIAADTPTMTLDGTEIIPIMKGGAPDSIPATIISGRFKYTNSDSASAHSLAHATGLQLNDTFETEYYSALRRDSSGGVWRVIQTDAVSTTPGNISNGGTGSNGGVRMEGAGGIVFAFVPGPGAVVDIEQVGIVCDGTTTGQHDRFAIVVAAAKDRGWKIVTGPKRRMKIVETVDVRFVDCDLRFQAGTQGGADFYTAVGTNLRCTITEANPGVVTTVDVDGVTPIAHGLNAGDTIKLGAHGLGNLPPNLSQLTTYYVLSSGLTSTSFQVATSAGGATINTTVGSTNKAGAGPLYVFIPPAAVANIQTEDIVLWNGTIKRLGKAVLTAGDGSINDGVTQKVDVWGDGNFDFSVHSTVCGAQLDGDDGPHGIHDIHATYCYLGVVATGALEKKVVRSEFTYCEIAAYMNAAASCDTMLWIISGTRCREWYREYPGIPTSVTIEPWVEGRTDPGDDSPAFWFRNGKFSALGAGQIRAHEGLRHILVDKHDQFGADTFEFKGTHIIHGYGNQIELRRVRRVKGSFHMKDILKGPAASGTDTSAAVRMGRVMHAGGLSGMIGDCSTTTLLQIGEEAGDQLYSREVDFGTWSLQCDNLTNVTDANTDTASNAFPSNRIALDVQRAKGGSITLTQCIGDIVVGPSVSASNGLPFTIVAPPSQKRYNRTIDGAASVRYGYPALIDPATDRLPTSAIPDLSADATFQEAVRDIIASALQAGSNVVVAVDDPGNLITVSAPGAAGSFDGLFAEYTTTSPAAPANGVLTFARNRAGQRRLAYRNPVGRPKSVQTLLGTNKTRFYLPVGNGTTVGTIGFNISTGGTVTARTAAITNNYTMLSRLGFVAASAAANQVFGARNSSLLFSRSNSDAGTPGNSGFELIVRYGWAVADGNLGRIAVGMFASGSAISLATDPVNLTNCVFIGADDGDQYLSIYCNDGSGTCTKTSLGTSFPAKTAALDAYEVRIFCAPDGDRFYWSCENLFTGAIAEGSLTTDIPAATTLLTFQIQGCTGTSTQALALDIISVYMETDY